MNVDTFTRIDHIALIPPPNETFSPYPAKVIQGLGGKTGSSGAGGMIPPQNLPHIIGVNKFGQAEFVPPGSGDVATTVVVKSMAPPDRTVAGIYDDGGHIIFTPQQSVRIQEMQKGVVDIVGQADMAELKRMNFFKPGQYADEGK